MNEFERQRAMKHRQDFETRANNTWKALHFMNNQLRDWFIKSIIDKNGTWLHKWLVKYPRVYWFWIFHYMKPRVFTKKNDMNYFVVIFRGVSYDIEAYRQDLLKKAKLAKAESEKSYSEDWALNWDNKE